MKRICFLLLCFLLLFLSGAGAEDAYESLKLINATNWVSYFDDLLGYRYDSHGCLHFSPADIYLLYKTIPPGIPLTVKKYQLKQNEPPFPVAKVPYLADMTNSLQDIDKHRRMFKAYPTELVVYPSLDRLFILVNGYPYAKIMALAGLPEDYLMAYGVKKGQPITWDFMRSTPTDPGTYKVLRVTDHYLSSAYYKNTVVPFGAWIRQVKGVWSYQKDGKWHKLPKHIAADLGRPAQEREYSYYDVSVDQQGRFVAGRYAGHDFGKYVLLWTQNGQTHYPEMGYAAGELAYEQIILVKDLVHLLTVAGPDEFDVCVSKNENFTFYKGLYQFKSSQGKQATATKVDPALFSYYKLFNGFELTQKDRQLIDPRVSKAFKEYQENRLPRDKQARWQALGLYYYLRFNSLVIDKQAYWYEKVKNDWELFKELRAELRNDFDRMGVLALENRQNILEGWLNERLEFKPAALPKQAKYLTDLSFANFFKPQDESMLFTERERAVMQERIRQAVKGEVKGLDLNIVEALNKYNFGVLLNEILGDLYKSHGCMHVSPRNSVFLFELLPVGARMKVYKYSERVSQEALAKIPSLADLVDFEADLDKLKEKFASTREVQVAVYPYSGDWIIYVKDRPLARLRIRGGPQTKFYLLQGRDKDGKPVFEDHLAYPTSPGDYYIFRKTEHYLSNIYHDQTVIPMGGTISWREDKDKWIFQDKNGNWKDMPKMVAADLARPPAEREYTYYDTVKNPSGEVVGMKWGSHPFGQYALQTTIDRKTPFPELIHSSGDLIMEERQLVNDLIKVLTAPHDALDDCIKYSQNFELYKICYDYTRNPKRDDLIQMKERAAYKLYYGMTMSSQETASLPQDVIIANKVLKGKELTNEEIRVLIDNGIAYKRGGKLKTNMSKVLGLQFDTYQYVVTIQKYAHHYGTLKKHWEELSGLRRALLKDFNTFVIKDPQLFHNFMRELMLKRNRLEKLTQEKALELLNEMLGQEGDML
ncbi:hypothetical protein ACFL4J_00095 [Candidatus Margulisiibacteriota bacterium]